MNPYARKLFIANENQDQSTPIELCFAETALYNSFTSDVFEKSMAGEPVRNYTSAFITTKGERIDVLLSAELIESNKQVQGILLVANDITELLKTVRELKVSNTELERFAYVASHDLQEPLRKVSLFLQMLETRYKDKIDQTADHYITSAVTSARQMRQLIRDLLEYSHLSAAKEAVEAVDMNEVVESVLSGLAKEIEDSGASIKVDKLPVLQSSVKTQMVQLIQNLLTNALKYRSEKAPQIKISAAGDGSHWFFSVADNGIGIDPEFHDKVFIIFKRLHNKNEYSGTGVGLSICKKIVEQHGGRIWVESHLGRGATFNFTISKSPNPDANVDTAPVTGSQMPSFVV
jgi:light-regulated signal transduction histidine kinase (bacteriophytochrome)